MKDKYTLFESNLHLLVTNINQGKECTIFAVDRGSKTAKHYDVYIILESGMIPLLTDFHRVGLIHIEPEIIKLLKTYSLRLNEDIKTTLNLAKSLDSIRSLNNPSKILIHFNLLEKIY